jgi:hypothetical protein
MGRAMGEKKKKKRRAVGGIIIGVKLGIEEKRQERGEEEGCRKRNVHIGNEWWKIITVSSKEMKTTARRVGDTMKEDREECMLGGGNFNG